MARFLNGEVDPLWRAVGGRVKRGVKASGKSCTEYGVRISPCRRLLTNTVMCELYLR